MIEGEQITTSEQAPAQAAADREQASHAAAPASKRSRTLDEIMVAQFNALQSNLQLMMQTDQPEAVHKMRVATRRLQAAIDLLVTKDNKKAIAKLRSQLRDWRRMLSLVRNYDVFLMLLDKEISARKSNRRPRFEILQAHLSARRERRVAKARKYFSKVDVAEFGARLGLSAAGPQPQAAGSPPAEDHTVEERQAEQHQAEHSGEQRRAEQPTGPPPQAARIALPDEKYIAFRIADRLDQRLSEFQLLAANSHVTTDPQELHQLRIAAKRLRYLLEIVAEMGAGDTSRALAGLRLLQDKIGDWHDLEALEEEIIGIVSRRKFMRENLSESSRMLQAAAHLQRKKEALASKLFPIRSPMVLTTTAKRVAKALRHKYAETQPPEDRKTG